MHLNTLLQQRSDLWRGRDVLSLPRDGIPTGFPALDRLLPGLGWPRGGLTEVLSAHGGVEALPLLMPALVRLSRENQWVAWIAPPYVPYAPALASQGMRLSSVLLVTPERPEDRLWALEQALRSGACSIVLAWPGELRMAGLRRLQLAAEAGRACGVLFRCEKVAGQASPAALRLRVESTPRGLCAHLLKRRGGRATGPLQLELANRGAMARA